LKLLTRYEITVSLLVKYRAAYSIVDARVTFLDGLILHTNGVTYTPSWCSWWQCLILL